MTIITENLLTIKKTIAHLEQQYQRQPQSVTLLAVSKGQSIEKIKQALEAGQRLFAENYLQEALAKIHALSDKKITWHFIGSVQNNKTKKIAEHFAWVHSVDNLKTAQRLHEQRPLHLPPLNICLQMNLDREVSKGGMIDKNAVFLLAKNCLSLSRLKLRGLMVIPKAEKNFALQRAAFHDAFLLWQQLRANGFDLDTLSMGMSDDFAAAIAEGTTLVRIGSAIFGQRDPLF